ncbi:MAG: hypothetical protein PHN84_08040 [Desulfuromonadaceae bacterium]|nr:hypothetical protein [Desulfuromonadaceae bacterium]MDD2856002.1 hypothetical protein [Desulfuromonadaceae bacterium]
MITVKTGIRPEEVRQQAQHVLFVEGKDNESVDPKTLSQLFDKTIRIEPMGASYSVKSVAEALFAYHPTYYFLIDRDHHDENFVDRCWNNFPDPGTYNLLIWRKREIENYFLDPEYLQQSKYCKVSKDEITRKILQFVNERLYLDVANHVVTSIREELKGTWINKFSNPAEFPSETTALAKLQSANEFEQHKNNVTEKVSGAEIETRFNDFLQKMTGGTNPLNFGHGEWIGMCQGKKIFTQVINSGCFQVLGTSGAPLAGKEKLNAVVKDLLQKDSSIQPQDFVSLKQLIEARVSGSV